MGGGLCVGVALGYHQVALGVLGVGVAGRQGKQVAAGLYQHGVYIVRLYNFQLAHAVNQRVPRRCQGNFVADLYLLRSISAP